MAPLKLLCGEGGCVDVFGVGGGQKGGRGKGGWGFIMEKGKRRSYAMTGLLGSGGMFFLRAASWEIVLDSVCDKINDPNKKDYGYAPYAKKQWSFPTIVENSLRPRSQEIIECSWMTYLTAHKEPAPLRRRAAVGGWELKKEKGKSEGHGMACPISGSLLASCGNILCWVRRREAAYE